MIAFGEAGVFTVVVARRARTGKRTGVVDIAGAGFDVGVFVSLVVPARAADAKTVVLLVRDLHFAHHIDPIGHHIAPIKLGVGLVVAGVIGQRGVAPLGPYAQVVTHGVVPARVQSGLPVSNSAACTAPTVKAHPVTLNQTARLNGFSFASIINTPITFLLLLAAEALGRLDRANER